MSPNTLLEQMLESNKSFLAGSPRKVDGCGDSFVVVACIDSRLTGFLEPALGLLRARAFVVRTAGNRLAAENHDALRSIAAALYVKEAREVFIVGHTDCAMSSFSAATVAENFRKAGVLRSVFGDEDLRTWFGAIAGVEANVIESVDWLRQSGIIGQGIKVHGLILDIVSGAVRVVANGDLAQTTVAAPKPMAALETPSGSARVQTHAAPSAESLPPMPPLPAEQQAARDGAIVIEAEPQAAAAPMTYVDAIHQLRRIFQAARQDPELRRAVANLAVMVQRDRNPARILPELARMEKEFSGQYPELASSIDILRKSMQTQKGSLNFMELMRRLLE